jgi:hypothetical protein
MWGLYDQERKISSGEKTFKGKVEFVGDVDLPLKSPATPAALLIPCDRVIAYAIVGLR